MRQPGVRVPGMLTLPLLVASRTPAPGGVEEPAFILWAGTFIAAALVGAIVLTQTFVRCVRRLLHGGGNTPPLHDVLAALGSAAVLCTLLLVSLPKTGLLRVALGLTVIAAAAWTIRAARREADAEIGLPGGRPGR